MKKERKKERKDLDGTNHIGVYFHSIQNTKQWGLGTCQVRVYRGGGGGGWGEAEVVDSALPLVFDLCIFLLYPKPSSYF